MNEFNFDETFSLVSHLEAIRLLLGVSCLLKFKLYQMDMKSRFLDEYLNGEVYVEQPKGLINSCLLNYMYKLKKDLYGLKQAPIVWHERLTKFITSDGYVCRELTKLYFLRKKSGSSG